jgi:putative ABC transport system permease protein
MRPNAPPEDVQPFAVNADYFNTLRIPLRRGRLLLPTDGPTAPHVTVINEQMARQAFPGEDPLGKRITLGDPDDVSSWMTIVGVVGNIAQVGVTAKPYSQLYESIMQRPSRVVYVSIRTDRDPARLVPTLRNMMREVGPDLVVNDIATLESLVARDIARPRLSVWLLTAFSAMALLLAAIGIYGVMAYTVAQRTREIGVRMALGADPASVERLIVWQGMKPALVGVVAGLAGAFAASRLIASLLYGVSALDPVTFVLVPLFLAAIALLATYLPARRATRISPTVALQSE